MSHGRYRFAFESGSRAHVLSCTGASPSRNGHEVPTKSRVCPVSTLVNPSHVALIHTLVRTPRHVRFAEAKREGRGTIKCSISCFRHPAPVQERYDGEERGDSYLSKRYVLSISLKNDHIRSTYLHFIDRSDDAEVSNGAADDEDEDAERAEPLVP